MKTKDPYYGLRKFLFRITLVKRDSYSWKPKTETVYMVGNKPEDCIARLDTNKFEVKKVAKLGEELSATMWKKGDYK